MISERLRKTLLLKEFAVRNGYKVPHQILTAINELELDARTRAQQTPGNGVHAEDRTKLDAALIALTAVSLPITADSLAEGSPDDYAAFKKRLLRIGLFALCFAVLGLVSSVRGIQAEVGQSVLAISLGSLGAVVYSFFDAVGVVPAQTFNRNDKYTLYARLELGVLLGWIFYLGFARQVVSPAIPAPMTAI